MGPTPSEDEQHYNDKRNWPRYDELLVLRGELYLSTDWMRSWDGELGMINGGKRGRLYDFPEK